MTIEISRLEINDTDIGCVVSVDTVVEVEDLEEDLLVGIRLVAPPKTSHVYDRGTVWCR